MPQFLHRYLERYASSTQQIEQDPQENLGIIVVIPCHNEPNMTTTLDALNQCHPPTCGLEIIIVINASTQTTSNIIQQNHQTHDDIQQWSKHHPLTVHTLLFHQLEQKHAGVGLARKIGMDEATRRFTKNHNPSGIIVSLDADCLVSTSYFIDIYQSFQTTKQPACVIPFQHQHIGLSPQHTRAIQLYELEILYHCQGLKNAHYPNSFHTLGSCFAVSVYAYAAQGGMNRRKAAEDFYFLHKVAELGHIPILQHCCVYPSARLSYRVPFGTGQALQTWMNEEENTRMVVHPNAYQELAVLFKQLDILYHDNIILPYRLEQFLKQHNFLSQVTDMRNRVRYPITFRKRFLKWFHALRIRQYMNHCGKNTPIENAAAQLIQQPSQEKNVSILLEQYRRLS